MPRLFIPSIFRRSTSVRAAMTLRSTSARDARGFNMSVAVGDDPGIVERNRQALVDRMGFERRRLALQRQVHGINAVHVEEGYVAGESDALMTDVPGWLLGASIADCVPVLVHDARNAAVAAVHSGWRGTEQNIVAATLDAMSSRYGTEAGDLRVFIGPAAGGCCYEVREDVAGKFPERYSRPYREGTWLFDTRGVVLDQVMEWGVPSNSIEVDPRCTICDASFHSFRRDAAASGRMLAVIGLQIEEDSEGR